MFPIKFYSHQPDRNEDLVTINSLRSGITFLCSLHQNFHFSFMIRFLKCSLFKLPYISSIRTMRIEIIYNIPYGILKRKLVDYIWYNNILLLLKYGYSLFLNVYFVGFFYKDWKYLCKRYWHRLYGYSTNSISFTAIHLCTLRVDCQVNKYLC